MEGKRSLIEKRDQVGLVAFLFFCVGVLGSAAALCAAALGVFIFSFRTSRRHFLILCLTAVTACTLGFFRMQASLPDGTALSESIDSSVTLTGKIVTEPIQKGEKATFILEQPQFAVSVGVDRYEDIEYGDIVKVTGILRVPENFITDQGSEFDYVSYLYKDDILYTLPKSDVVVVSRANGNPIIAILGRFQKSILQSFRSVLPAPEAALLGGLLLGTKSSIRDDFRNELVETGTIHIIALSGSNVTIVANTFRAILARIPAVTPQAGSIAGALGVVLFVTMTGLQSSAVRSGIMAIIGIFARSTGRQYTATRALLFAAAAMIIWDPKYLVYDVSFHLSFLATLGLIFLVPILGNVFSWVREKVLWFVPLREMVTTTAAAQIAVTPYILYTMGTFSFVSLPANIFILPVIPIVMATGTGAGLIGLFSPDLALPFANVSYGILAYIRKVVSLFAKVPHASVNLPGLSLFVCIILYGIFVHGVYRTMRQKFI